MSWTTEGAFEAFYGAINLSGEHRLDAQARREWVVNRLRANGLDVIESMPFGSIPRYTALKEHADVDVLVALHYNKHIDGRKPSQVLSTVRAALAATGRPV